MGNFFDKFRLKRGLFRDGCLRKSHVYLRLGYFRLDLSFLGQLGDRRRHVLPVRLEAHRTSPGLQRTVNLS